MRKPRTRTHDEPEKRTQQVLSVHVNAITANGQVSLTAHMPHGTPKHVTLSPGDNIEFHVDIEVSPNTLTWK